MSLSQLAKQSYKNTQRELTDDKIMELRVFSQITSRMKAADIDAPGGMSALAEALTDNMKLWNILLVDLSMDSNPLPQDLKAQIISLARFTQSHTLKVLGGTATVDVLVDINTAMINGMRAARENAQNAETIAKVA